MLIISTLVITMISLQQDRLPLMLHECVAHKVHQMPTMNTIKIDNLNLRERERKARTCTTISAFNQTLYAVELRCRTPYTTLNVLGLVRKSRFWALFTRLDKQLFFSFSLATSRSSALYQHPVTSRTLQFNECWLKRSKKSKTWRLITIRAH